MVQPTRRFVRPISDFTCSAAPTHPGAVRNRSLLWTLGFVLRHALLEGREDCAELDRPDASAPRSRARPAIPAARTGDAAADPHPPSLVSYRA